MMNEYTALMYGVMIGYGICVLVHKRLKGRFDWLVLVLIYVVLLFLSLKIEI